MERTIPGGIVIDFGPNGYKACTAKDVIACQGHRGVADRHGSVKSLEQFLSYEFINCHIGRRGLFYDSGKEKFNKWPYMEEDKPLHIVTTQVVINPWG